MERGSKLLCVLRPLCVDLALGANIFFLLYGPPYPRQGSRVQTPGTPGCPPPPPWPWALAGENFAVFMLHRMFSGT